MTEARRTPIDRTTGATLLVAQLVSVLSLLPVAVSSGTIPAPDPTRWLIAAAVGVCVGLGYWRGYRVVGLVPPAVTLIGGSCVAVFWAGTSLDHVSIPHGFGFGLLIGSVGRYELRGILSPAMRSGARPRTPRFDRVVGVVVSLALIAVLALRFFSGAPLPLSEVTVSGLSVAWLVLIAFAWVRLFREFFELCLEPPYWLSYRVRGCGPGLDAIPYLGPILIVANHAAWWDPVFLAKPMHRPITPMMTSKFFDIWFLRPLVKYAFGVIRVADASYRRDAPEIAEAVRALDAGECVVIFPEGFLRRKEEVPLRRFGRGVWEILRQRPETPVVACWIEGNWGAWPSHFNGPPTKNKPHDFRRPIDVAFSAPITLPPETLADHFATRFALMNAVAAARSHLGLPPLPRFALPETDDEAKQPA